MLENSRHLPLRRAKRPSGSMFHGNSVVAARKVQENAAPEVVEAVERGELSLSKAAKLTKAQPDKKKQAKAVASETVDKVIQKAAPAKPQVEPDSHVELTAVIAGRDITRETFQSGRCW